MSIWSDLAQWRGPTVNVGDGDSNISEPADRMYEYRGIVVHIAVGYYEGTIAWQKNPDANVSSHFVVARDGRIAQMVDTAIRAWTQSAGNGYWLSVENEGFLLGDRRNPGDWHLLSPAMVEANARLLARAHREYGVPLQLATSPTGRGLGYHSMGAENGYNWGHSACPGEPIKAQLASVLARAIEIVKGEDEMKTVLVQGPDGRVFLSNGMFRVHVGDHTDTDKVVGGETVLRDTHWVSGNVLGTLVDHVVRTPDDLDAFGIELPADLAERLDRIEARPSSAPAPIEQDALNAAVMAAITNPAVLAAIAAAVRPVVDSELDEAFTGGADKD